MLKGTNDTHHNDLHIKTNCVGPCLLYNLLLPLLTKTATYSPTGSVRVAWAGSIAMQVNAPKPGGMEVDDAGRPQDTDDELSSYGQSKAGNVFLARKYAKTTPQTGVVHACFNPGNLKTGLQRHWSGLTPKLMVYIHTYTFPSTQPPICLSACDLQLTNVVRKGQVVVLPS